MTPSLGMGGAERVVQVLAQEFGELGHDVTVVTTTRRADFYRLAEGVQRIRLDLSGKPPGQAFEGRLGPRAVVDGMKALREMRNAIREAQSDLVISFLEDVNVITLVSCLGIAPVVVTEHADARRHGTRLIWRSLRRVLYAWAAALVSVSEGVDARFSWVNADRRFVIPNPLPQLLNEFKVVETGAPRTITAMGRLTWEKGFDLLLEAFARIAPEHRDWRLDIIGEGPERRALEGLVSQLRLGNQVSLLGGLEMPFPKLARAEFFVLSSRSEGFGNVVAEALACGLPVVAYDCASGPSEIVINGHNGLLVPPEDVDRMADALNTMMVDSDLRSSMRSNARRSVEHLKAQQVASLWERKVFALVRR